MLQVALGIVVGSLYVWQRPFDMEANAATIDKHNLLDHQTSPRIVLIGGSGFSFGIKSPLLERETGYHPVNMGLNMGYGLDFMLHEVEDSLRAGDVVIVSPEYDMFGDFYYGQGPFIYSMLEHRPANLKYLSFGNVRELSDKGFLIVGGIFRYTVTRQGKEDKRILAIEYFPYRRRAYNEYGDMTAHYPQPRRPYDIDMFAGPTTRHLTLENIDRAIDGMNRFAERCRRKEVRVFFSFAAISDHHYRLHAEVINLVAARLRQRLNFQIINTPDDAALPLDLFYDTYYHLTGEGAERNTQQLIDKLRKQGVGVKQE